MAKLKLCAVTGSRADYGLLYWVMKTIVGDGELTLQTVVTGMHLSSGFGSTYRQIEADGFAIDAKVEMLLAGDTSVSIAKSIGIGVIGFADAFDRLKPDIVVILGDRFESFAAAQAALIARIPIAHIAGGDVTEGAYDEAIRHSITKMAHVHLVTNAEAARRVRQLGEDPSAIVITGSPGLDYIKRATLLTREEVERVLGFQFKKRNLLATFHPVTLDGLATAEQFGQLLAALDELGEDVGVVMTHPNADNDNHVIKEMIESYVASHGNAKAFPSLGSRVYLSVMAQVDAVVGNSSSGLYEAPFLRKSAVNIGDRQKGRLQARSVINARPDSADIVHAIRKAFAMDCSDVISPYGDGESARRIVAAIKAKAAEGIGLKKRFFDQESRF